MTEQTQDLIETNGNGLQLSHAEAQVEAEKRAFELAQRQAKVYADSTIVPNTYKNNIGNVMIAKNISNRIGMDLLVVMQELYIVQGKPSWSSKFLIATFNASGKYSAIKYRQSGKGDDYGYEAYCTELATGDEIVGPKVTVKMCKDEGWWSKKDKYGKESSKWQSIPELMFRYRSAAFLIRTTAPEIGLGLMTVEELRDIHGNDEKKQPSVGTASLEQKMLGAPEPEPNNDVDLEPEETPEVLFDNQPTDYEG